MTDKSDAFFFGGKLFPTKIANRHIIFLGTTGSGKSASLSLLMQSLLPGVGRHAHEGGHRAFVYDAKQEMLPVLWEMGLTCPIVLCNPFDVRSLAWDIAADITSPAAAYEMATLLLPVSENAAQPFFENAAINLLCGTFKALHLRTPHAWTLRHVCLVLRSEHHMKELFSQTHVTRHLVRRYLQGEKLSQSVLATLDSKMEPYSIIAALWHHALARFSLREFVRGESILILGSHEEARAAIDAINRVLFSRLTELLLGQGDSNTRRTFLFLDEIREAGNMLARLSSLLLRGRSRGACIFAGAQDKDGLEDVQGEKIANELLGQFGFKGILKLESPTTAEWASTLFSATEVKERNNQSSHTFGREEPSFTQGVSEVLRDRKVVLPNEIMNLPLTSAREGLSGYYKTPFGSFKEQIDFVPLLRRRPDVERQSLPANFMPRDEHEQYLEDWTEEELAQFGLTPIPPETPPQRTRAPRQPRGINRDRNRNRGKQSDVNNDQEEDDSGEEEDF